MTSIWSAVKDQRSPANGTSASIARLDAEAVDVDRGQLVYPSLEDVPVVVDLPELAPVRGWATSGRHRRRFEWFTRVREDLADGRWVGDERDQSDVAAARWALERKLLPHPGQQLGPGNPGGVVPAGFLMRVAARGMRIARMPASHGAADHGQPLECKRGPGTVSEQVLETLKIARHSNGLLSVIRTKSGDREPTVLPGEHVGGGRGVEEASEPEESGSRVAHDLMHSHAAAFHDPKPSSQRLDFESTDQGRQPCLEVSRRDSLGQAEDCDSCVVRRRIDQ
jgi:hypothetical protein